jgi:hypothetical protein
MPPTTACAFPDDEDGHFDASRLHPDLLDDLLGDERLDRRWIADLDEPWQPDDPWTPTDFDDGLI